MNEFNKANVEFSKFSRHYMNIKKDLPIRPSEMGVLNVLMKIEGAHTPLKIAEYLGVSRPMVAKLLDSLEKKGYIQKQQVLEDKRSFLVLPTPKAKQLVDVVDDSFNQMITTLKNKMGQDDFSKLLKLISFANLIIEDE